MPGLARAGIDLQYLTFHPVPLPQTSLNPAHDSVDPVVELVMPSPDPAARETGYRSAMAAIRNTQGFNALPVSEQALELGQLLQQQGQLDAALDAYETSMHVLRVNLGLYSLEQVPVLKAIINTQVERRDVVSAHMMQEALFNLVLRHHGRDNLAAVPALLEWADWNVNLYLLLDPAPSVSLSHSTHPQHYDPRLALAYSTYQVALQSLQEDAPPGDERLVTTERKLAALNFIINRKMHDAYGNALAYYPMTPVEAPDAVLEEVATAHFYDGSSALRRALAHSYSRPERRNDDIAARMVELGDWYLLFDRRAAALDLYRDALHFMQEASLPQEDVERIMSSGMPVPTPDTAYLATSTDEEEFDGFIDVEFELSKFGMASNPHIIGSSAANRQIERELLLEIRSCKFRPKFVADAPTSEKMQLRYYYSL